MEAGLVVIMDVLDGITVCQVGATVLLCARVLQQLHQPA